MSRLEYWKTQQLTPTEQKSISDIGKYGVHLVEVPEDEDGPGFVYSIGLYDRFSHPEIIIVGLESELAHDIVNGLAEEVASGVVFHDQDVHKEILEDYACVFLDVLRENYPETLGHAIWYYGGVHFPVIQCVWPDLNGAYPWDGAASDDYVEDQPLLA